jgi:hypothetical protein
MDPEPDTHSNPSWNRIRMEFLGLDLDLQCIRVRIPTIIVFPDDQLYGFCSPCQAAAGCPARGRQGP